MPGRKKIALEDLRIDFTSMIDCTFLLIIFFLLMPMREMEGHLESYLPQEGGSKPANEAPKTSFTLMMKSEKVNDQEMLTKVLFAGSSVGEFRTFTQEYLDHIYTLPEKESLLGQELKRDETQFDPGKSEVLKKLLSSMENATRNTEEGRSASILVDASPDVPFKVVLAIINATAGAHFSKIKFMSPDRKIWENGR